MKKPKLIQDIETLFTNLIKSHGMTMDGEPLDPDVYRWSIRPWETDISFNDENMGYLLAGYVASSIFDEMEQGLKNLGFNISDSDGSNMTLERIYELGPC
jgi:hypothetical protein